MYQLHSCLGNCHHLVRLVKGCLPPSTRQWLNKWTVRIPRLKERMFFSGIPSFSPLSILYFIHWHIHVVLASYSNTISPNTWFFSTTFALVGLVFWHQDLRSVLRNVEWCVIPMYSKCKTQKGSKMIKFLHLDKCYILQKLSDPIRCKAEKGFSAESSPMNKRSFELWGKVFIHIGWPLIV